ncbi:MAG: homoserine dehydrogenase [Desulfobacteraceae bacterium]|jgi:homoserine dehydrogenase|nr:homoserine dehydrogenase [Desulfobacteraceae bacterium]
MKEIKVGILGLGTVGTGIAKIIYDNAELITSRLGAKLTLKKAADIDLKTDRGINFDDGVLTDDAFKVINDPEIDIVIEMIGGETIAKDFILKAIENGKHIVTANKALLAAHGNMLFKLAAEKGVSIAFEPSVGGCMPIIKTIRESLVGNNITSISGILNGTCNYILSKLTNEGGSFEDALSEAQAEGFAEADPTLDIEGYDTAHKLAILSSIAYGTEINLEDIYVEGITNITAMDIEFANQYGYRIKLLAITKFTGDAIDARVHPTMIPFSNPLSNVNGSLNAVTISGDAVGDMMLYGHGAGMMPTASAAISDTIDIARDLLNGIHTRVPMLSFQMDKITKIPTQPIDEISTFYYIRFSALDQPGVLSTLSGILGDHDISIKSVHQTERKSNGAVPIFMLTHLAKEAEIQKALAKILSLGIITVAPALIRIEGSN